MLSQHRAARMIPIAALLIAALVACSDNSTPTAPLTLHPSFTQLAASPVVNSLNDPGTGTCDDTECTLREAIDFASPGATITFTSGLTGTITLTSTDRELEVSKSITITGPGPGNLSISGGDTTTLFWLVGGNISISGVTLTHARASLGTGGAIVISNAGTTLSLSNCAVTDNRGLSQGGGIKAGGGDVTITSCTLSGNSASSGAALWVYSGTVRIINSTISGNSGFNAVVSIGGTLILDHTTITGNSGSGVHASYANAPITVKGSIIWGNTDADVDAGDDNAFTSLGYNLVGTGDNNWVNFGHDFTATGDQTGVADAKIGALALNSPGTTKTHALLSGSPAINAGVCTDAASATLATDQRGVTRPQGSACDIGAYELQSGGGGLDPGFTFDVSSLGTVTYGNGPFSISGFAHTNSSGYISFALGSGSAGCSVSTGGTVTITGAAIDPSHCVIEASVAADATYSGAGPISQSFNIAKATGSVSINNIPSSAAVGGSFTPTYTKSGDGTASTVSNSTSVCTVTSGVVDFIAAGSCLLQASVTEGTNHLSATGSEQNFDISLITPTFTFDISALPAKTFGNGTFSVAGYANTNSTGTISFATTLSSFGCDVTSAGMVTVSGIAEDPNHCIIRATLPANGAYAGAGPIDQSFNIARAAGSVSINNMPSSATVADNFTPTFTVVGDGTASVTSLTTAVCTVDGSGVVTFISAGTCTLRASVTEGTNHLAADGSQQSVTVLGVFSSACTYTINAKNDQRQVTISWQNASPGVTQIQLTDGRTVTKQLSPTATGSWSTNVKTGVPTYGLWGGTSRRDATTTHVTAGTACVLQ